MGEFAASYLGLDRQRLTRFDDAVFWSGWALVIIGVALWVRFRLGGTAPGVADTLRDWQAGTQRLAEKLGRQLTRLGYESASDVREPIKVTPGPHVLTGESGQGKTWCLAGTAMHFSRQGGAVVWAGSHIDLANIESEVARVIWNEGFEGESDVDLATLSRHCRGARGKNSDAWLLICLDNSSAFDKTQALCQLDLEGHGIALLLSSPNDVADRIKRRKIATVHRVGDFTVEELRRFLHAHGKQHISIASDIERLIRRPVLATVYVLANQSKEWVPASEYALLDAYWQSIDDLGVKSTLQRLGDTLLADPASYPWRISHLVKSGISNEEISQSIGGGILRRSEDGCVELWHLRFLAWTYADALARAWKASRLTTEAFADALVGCYDNAQRPHTWNIEYAAMDAMWLACGLTPSDQWKLIQTLDQSLSFVHRTESLYGELLCTLGSRIVQPIIDRVRESGDQDGNQYPRLACSTLTIVGRVSPDAIVAAIKKCLHDDQAAVVELGLRLAGRFACPDEVEHLWRVHLARARAREQSSRGYFEQEQSQAAFRAAVAARPEWLDVAISKSEEDCDALVEFAYTLANSEETSFDAIWKSHKAFLFRQIPSNRRRSLAACIFRFRDYDELVKLEEWVSEQSDLLGSTCIQVLGFFDAKRASAVLPRLPATHLRMISKAVGQSLFTGDAVSTREAVKSLIAAQPENTLNLVEIYENAGDQLDDETCHIILDKLQDDLASFESLGKEAVKHQLWHSLRFVESLHGRNILRALRSRRGTQLENLLAEFAILRADNNTGWFDHDYDNAKQILKRIAGEGFTRLVNALLEANARQSRLEGAESAVVRPDASTSTLLQDAALDDRVWDGNGGSGSPIVQREAINSLAVIENNRGLVKAVLHWGTRISPKVCDIRARQAPMSDADIAPAIPAIHDSRHTDHENALIAIGLSGRDEHVPILVSIFSETTPESPRALAVLLALEDLEGDLADVHERLAAQWRSGKHKFAALKLLLSRPEQWGDGFLFDLVPPDQEYDDIDERLLGFLYSRERTRSEAWNRLRKHFHRTNDGQRWRFLDSNIALDPNDADDFEELWQRCRVPEGQFIFGSSRAAAIRRLAEADAALATKLAEAALARTQEPGIDYLDILLRFGGKAGVRLVCDSAIDCNNRERCRSAGLIIRKHSAQQEAADYLRDGLRRTNWKNRRSAAMLAGYLGGGAIDDDLVEVVRDDRNWSVCVEAQQALRQLQMEKEAVKLAAELEESAQDVLWGTIDAVLRLADPDYLFMASDPLDVKPFLDNAPPHVMHYIEKATKKRREQVEKDLKSLHGRWKNDE